MHGTNTKTSVAVIEDNQRFRTELTKQLQHHEAIERVIPFPTAESFLFYENREEFGLLFVDIKMPGMDGIELIPHIKAENAEARIVMMSNLAPENHIVRAIQRGAIGYLWKSEINDIHNTVDIVLDGGATISPGIALKMIKFFQSETPEETQLTARERQILSILVGGANAEKAANHIGISVNTARKHIRNIYEKLQVNNRIEMMNKARKMGLV